MKRITALLLSLALAMCVCGCRKNPDELSSGSVGVDVIYEYEYEYEDEQGNIISSQSSSTKKDKETSSKSKSESKTDTSVSSQSNTKVDNSQHLKEENSISTGNNYVGKLEMSATSTDVSQDFWNNIESYVIIYGNDDNYDAAKRLSKHLENMSIRIPIYKDTDYRLSEKEILVGDTNRFSTGASNASYKVRMISGKLRFEGNNVAAVEAAMTSFLENCVHKQPLPVIDGELAGYKQPITVNSKSYNYVWGDEFEDSSVNFIDNDTWNTTGMMGYFSDFHIAPKEKMGEFTYVKDGKLILTAGEFDFTPYIGQKNISGKTITSDLKYANGGVLTTSERMVFRRGYAELRASVPTNNASWPAWWTRSTGGNLIKYEDGTTNLNPIYTLEVDIFECYGHLGDKVQPNMHKWYKNTIDQNTYDEVYGYDGTTVVTSRTKMKSKGLVSGNEAKQFSTAVAKDKSTWKQLNLGSKGSTTEEWHTYGFLWTEEKMSFIVDGDTYYTIDLTTDFDGFNDGKYGYNQYLYFLLDNHIFTPAANRSYCYNPSLPDPVFEIDYIRLYQLDGERDIILSE